MNASTNEPLEAIAPQGPPAGGPGRSRWLRATAAAAIVAAGGLGSWALAQPSSSSAVETAGSSTSATASDSGVADGGFRGGPMGHRGGHGLDAAAEALGLTEDELHAQLESGSTLAEIAAAQGVDTDELIAAMVAAAEADLDAAVDAGDLDADRADEIKADLLTRITAMVNGEMPMGGPGGHGHGGPGGRGGFGGPHLDTAAEVLGLSVDDLRTELESGSTLADVAAAQGVDVDTLIDALVDDARERITDMVNGVQPEAPAGAPTDAAA